MDYFKALVSSFGLTDALDVAIVAFVIYQILLLNFRNYYT